MRGTARSDIIRGARTLRTGGAAVAIAALAMLSGCVTSKQSLFEASRAATPLDIGRYAEEKNEFGRWEKNATVELSREGRLYRVRRDNGDIAPEFTLHDAGDGSYVAVHVSVPDKEWMYGLFRKEASVVVYYELLCKDFRLVRMPSVLWPMIDGADCVYDDRRKLTQALLAYARVSHPDKRYVLLGR